MTRTLDSEGICIRCGVPDVHCFCPDAEAAMLEVTSGYLRDALERIASALGVTIEADYGPKPNGVLLDDVLRQIRREPNMTESVVLRLVDQATEGCCQNAEWRGLLCTYHEGYREGLRDMRELLLAVAVEPVDAPCSEQDEAPGSAAHIDGSPTLQDLGDGAVGETGGLGDGAK